MLVNIGKLEWKNLLKRLMNVMVRLKLAKYMYGSVISGIESILVYPVLNVPTLKKPSMNGIRLHV